MTMGRSEGEKKKRKASSGGNTASVDVAAVKKAKVEGVDGKGKGKIKAAPPTAVITATARPSMKGDTAFQVIKATMVVSVPPRFAANPTAGVEEMLDGMVMRYIPGLRGVVISHSNLVFLKKAADIKVDCPFLVCDIGFDALVWSPTVGSKLIGRVNICSPDHVGLLVHQTFNVSIPRHHIPIESWEFEYGAAENDPEFGPAAAANDEDNDHDNKDEARENKDEAQKNENEDHAQNAGRWIHKLTAEPLGGQKGYVEFTVIGFTVANEMISLIGSIQPDPFSPLHAPQTGNSKSQEAMADEEDAFDKRIAPSSDEEGSEDEEEDGESLGGEESGEDTFMVLEKKAAEEAAAKRRAEAEAEAAAQAEKEKRKSKKKRKAPVASEAGESGKKRKRKKE